MRSVHYACLVWAAGLVPSARAQDVTAHYEGYAKGFNVFAVDVGLALRRADYRMTLSFRLKGVLGALFHGDGTTVVDGRFDGARAMPRQAFSTGQFRGVPHALQLDWHDGTPVVTRMVPVADNEREPVSVADLARTVDTLSAVALLIHQVSETGRCEAAVRTFDGMRLSTFAARTGGEETLAPNDRSTFQGAALRCDVTGQMIGGFMRDKDRRNQDDPALRKPKEGSAWFARLQPGQPPLPVKIVFYSDGSPAASLYLNAEPAP